MLVATSASVAAFAGNVRSGTVVVAQAGASVVSASNADATPTVTAIRLRRPNRLMGSSLHRHGRSRPCEQVHRQGRAGDDQFFRAPLWRTSQRTTRSRPESLAR